MSTIITDNLLLCHQSNLTTIILNVFLFVKFIPVIYLVMIKVRTHLFSNIYASKFIIFFTEISILSFFDPFRAHLVCLLQHSGVSQSLGGCFAYLGWDRMNSQPLESKFWNSRNVCNYWNGELFLLSSGFLFFHFW